jgi:uncharacterized membrane protein
MLTYSPFEPANTTCALRGNALEGAFGPVNVGETERFASIVGGAALAAAGISRRSFPGLLLAAVGGLFILRGIGGHCRLYDSVGLSTSNEPGIPDHPGHKIERTILITRPPSELFSFWRNFENLPEFMENVESVHVLDDHRSHWVVKGPAGQSIEWDTEIINEHPGEMISWQTLPGADVQSAGTVRFIPADNGTSTLLRVLVEYRPPAGILGAHVARLFGSDPAARIDQDLARLKQIIENRDPTTVAG